MLGTSHAFIKNSGYVAPAFLITILDVIVSHHRITSRPWCYLLHPKMLITVKSPHIVNFPVRRLGHRSCFFNKIRVVCLRTTIKSLVVFQIAFYNFVRLAWRPVPLYFTWEFFCLNFVYWVFLRIIGGLRVLNHTWWFNQLSLLLSELISFLKFEISVSLWSNKILDTNDRFSVRLSCQHCVPLPLNFIGLQTQMILLLLHLPRKLLQDRQLSLGLGC